MTEMSITDIKKHLGDHGVKASLPRVKIYEYLNTHRSHPTVDEIYNALSDELITLSKTTVYNTLDLFVKHHLAVQVLIEDNEARYDADTSHHGHFKCTTCETVYDFNYDLSSADIPSLEGFKLVDYHTYIRGICNKCQEKLH
jgi:Fe2+ or Zn2+ uptake regulation protein